MKNFFFKKALPNSTSFDSTLNGHTHNNSHQLHNHQENNNNSIDKPPQRCVKIVQQRPTTLAPIGPPFGTSQQCHQMQTPSSFDHQQLPSSHQRVSPMSCSSTQGTIGGCAVGNELFEQQHQSGWQLVPFDSVQSPTAAQCHHRKPLLMVPQMSAPANGCSSGHQQPQQMPDFVSTLVQQLSIKDAEMERLRTALRRGRDAAERERERHAEEENAAREQISRMRRRLRTYETELEYAKRLNRQQTSTTTNQTNDNEAMAVAKCEKLMLDHAKMKTEMTQQQRATEEREAAWDRERAELNQTVRSLNNTLEELELELRQREVHGREMQLQLERTVVERDMAQMELLNKDQQHNRHPPQQHHQQQQQKKTTLILPTLSGVENGDPIEGSSATVADDGGGPSLASSSGIDSNSSVTDAKELDTKCLWLARRKLVECRQKVARLIRSAEKTLRGERLGRNDLFASFLSAHDEHQILPNSATQIQLIDDQITQIGALRKEMELLHDKFIILYARGTFEK